MLFSRRRKLSAAPVSAAGALAPNEPTEDEVHE
jgi:hypothetical protein